MSPRRTCYQKTDPLATDGYDDFSDPETGQRYCVDRETGEYQKIVNVDIIEGSRVITPQQQRAAKEWKKERDRLYIARKHREDLGDKFTFISCDPQLRKLQPATAVRLTLLSTYASYDTGKLLYRGQPMTLPVMANILRIGERSTRRLIDEAQDFLVQNDDGSFVLNTEYFIKGCLSKRRLRGKRYQQLHDNALRQIYAAVSPRQHKHLGYAFQMLEYLSVEYNVLCHNPQERELSEVLPLTCEEYCELIGYNYSNFARLKMMYSKLSVIIDGKREAFCSFVDNGHSTSIFVNPHIVYAGSQYDKVEVLGKFCEV